MDALNDKGDFERRPRLPLRYELIDKDGRVDSRSFENAAQVAEWAAFLWPDQQQDPDRTGAGWDVRAVQS